MLKIIILNITKNIKVKIGEKREKFSPCKMLAFGYKIWYILLKRNL